MRRLLLWLALSCTALKAQGGNEYPNTVPDRDFIETFNNTSLAYDTRGIDGWAFFTGDGNVTMSFTASGKGYATLTIDARNDKRGIWWALIKRCVSKNLDLNLLRLSSYEFRVETRIRVSDAPKRVNLHLNTQRTTDFHTHLMEFDIPDTLQWHTISMTTRNFDAQPGDTVYGQLALMDWGFEHYRVDIDYFRVSIVHVDSVDCEKGVPVPYHPPVPPVESFALHLPVVEDATIDTSYADVSFYHWASSSDSLVPHVLAVGGSKMILLRWDVAAFRGKKIGGAGILELRTLSVSRLTDSTKDFGLLRVSEIVGGDPFWKSDVVTYESWKGETLFNRLVNSQMIIDVDPNPVTNGATYITISKPVLQRILNGKTLGIVIKELGALFATFYSSRSLQGKYAPILHFSLQSETEEQ